MDQFNGFPSNTNFSNVCFNCRTLEHFNINCPSPRTKSTLDSPKRRTTFGPQMRVSSPKKQQRISAVSFLDTLTKGIQVPSSLVDQSPLPRSMMILKATPTPTYHLQAPSTSEFIARVSQLPMSHRKTPNQTITNEGHIHCSKH